MISRRKAREFAMQSLYAAEIGGTGSPDGAPGEVPQDDPVPPDQREYGLRLTRTVGERAAEIDRLIAESAERWDPSRLAVVDRAVLRVAIAELMTQPDVPVKVCINEAVEIARKFSTEKSSGFVNGVLDAVARRLRLRPEETAPAAPEDSPNNGQTTRNPPHAE